jgi:transposase
MAYNFLPAERDQSYLMPPSLGDWLPDEHLALFMLDVVGELDLSGFYRRYRPDGLGRAAYEPSVIVSVLLYAYCTGERSSRRVERPCTEDIAFRVLSADQVPDHATIARFLANHEDAFSALFCPVLSLCAAAGLLRLGVVAIRGTKMAANASGQANRSRADLEAEAKRIVAEAIATDQEEDARYGDARGDELPAELCDPRSRRARIAEANARLDQEEAERKAELAQRLATKKAAENTRTTRGGGRPLKEKQRRSVPRANVTDPDSSIMVDSHGYLQGYNAQAVVTADQIIVAADVTQEASDNHQLAPCWPWRKRTWRSLRCEKRSAPLWPTTDIGAKRARRLTPDLNCSLPPGHEGREHTLRCRARVAFEHRPPRSRRWSGSSRPSGVGPSTPCGARASSRGSNDAGSALSIANGSCLPPPTTS